MKKALLCFLSMVMLSACNPDSPILTKEQIESEKDAVVGVMNAYNRAQENKVFADMVKTLAGEVTFFGTDSGEVITTFAQFKDAITKQWQEYESMKYGPLTDVFVQMDAQASFASIICGCTLTVKKNGISHTYYIRMARTLKKENNKWVIVSGIVGIVRGVNPQDFENEKDMPEPK